ncbi:endonuclease/exonuclease/phosphatase family protein [Cryobacterium sp. TMT1-21]|uniref:Endonuclease/exonuclease/phosphatase family protein n=1 Tax=Cryobacterium shii TaxID=1259235 RepID=A0AAQ2HFM0_9MICO|nr:MULTISPECIES: endonuclease/exonuclease/phosphatase family protein [Cryobacterium]TFC45879.1 endonuclease/exonuclease/phosphatase family protein [Cryobacterium shii]TFC84404.1 endonuclease/exonuclease/phosphatase family protein [Cryobacterium sp. TmT2-59]TFD08706.1 endonuclease/exonuclease/phosphatase family protein [Cryobacterium sp. TMT1-21]TFD18496.1 endonuclease/exonuclease/phosphatase family protein [Cryobacterium sp. TMT4-10]TFD40534.1 endonuclease/exonuclease/phosphatase family protei
MTDVSLIGPVTAPDLHVMTYNIRRRMPRMQPGSPDRWVTRKPLLRRILRAEQPTLLGVQEALADQVEFVADSLGEDYGWVGRGRNAAGADEHCAVFYDSRRLELTGWRQQALSATPETPGSRSWGNLVRRIVVSAEFTDTATGARLLAFNTHLDFLSWRSRLESAKYILDLVRSARAAEPGAAIVLTGDFNADEGSAVYRRLIADGALLDSWEVAVERLTPQWGTFSNYRRRRPGGKRIDLILVGHGVDVLSVGINAARFDGRAASDHEPVQAVVRCGGRSAGTSEPFEVLP